MIVMMNVFNGFDIGNPMVDTDVIIGKIDENGYVTDDDGNIYKLCEPYDALRMGIISVTDYNRALDLNAQVVIDGVLYDPDDTNQFVGFVIKNAIVKVS